MIQVTLSTARLHLDSVTPADTDAIFDFCNDTALQGYVPVPVPYTRHHATSYTEGYAPKAAWLWAIRRRGDDRLLGVIELKSHELRSAELGYWLGHPHRGVGIMTEAATAVVDFGFSRDGAALTHIDWCAVVGNIGSATVARRIGMRFEGLRRQSLPHRDHREDAWFASILNTDDRTIQPGWPA
ncbi:MAG: GNAT family N-acetyltransferase [Salinibacterium sp.]|nr:GNAT family N-acetyltransferase [Salinibacterium sp.]